MHFYALYAFCMNIRTLVITQNTQNSSDGSRHGFRIVNTAIENLRRFLCGRLLRHTGIPFGMGYIAILWSETLADRRIVAWRFVLHGDRVCSQR